MWVAIATQATDGRFVEERLRDVLFGLVLTAAEAALWELARTIMPLQSDLGLRATRSQPALARR